MKTTLNVIVVSLLLSFGCHAQDQYWIEYNQEDEVTKATDVEHCVEHRMTTDVNLSLADHTTAPCTFDFTFTVKLADDSQGSQAIPSTLSLTVVLEDLGGAVVGTAPVHPVTGIAEINDIPGRQDYKLFLQHTGYATGTLHDALAISQKATNPGMTVSPDKLREMDMEIDGDVDADDVQEFMNKSYNGSPYYLTDYELKLSTYDYVNPTQPFEVISPHIYVDLDEDKDQVMFLLIKGNPDR